MPNNNRQPLDGSNQGAGSLARISVAMSRGIESLLGHRVVQVLLVLVFALGAALVLTPGLRKEGPLLKESDVGRPAPKDIKAVRTFQYVPPPEVLEKQRRQAAERVLTVYDHYPRRIQNVYHALTAALQAALDPRGLEVKRKQAPVDLPPDGVGPPRSLGRGPRKEATTSIQGAALDAGVTRAPHGAGMGSGASAGGGTGSKSRNAEIRLDPKKVAASLDARWRRFNKVLNDGLAPLGVEARTLSLKSFKVLYMEGMRSKKRRSVIEAGLRAVLLDDVILEKKYVRSAQDLRSPDGKPQKKIVVRTLRPDAAGRVVDTREQVVSNLETIGVLSDLVDRLSIKATRLQTIKGASLREAFGKLVLLGAVENMVRNDAETSRRRQTARRSIVARPITFVKGQLLVRAGELVTEEHLRVVRVMEGERSVSGPWEGLAGMAVFVLFFFLVLVWYLNGQARETRLGQRDLFVCGGLILGLMGLAELLNLLGSSLNWSMQLVHAFMPVAAGSALVRVLLGGPVAMAFSAAVAGFSSLALDGGSATVLYLFVSAVVGAASVSRIQTRFTLWRAGGMVAVANVLMVAALRTFSGDLVQTGTLLAGTAGLLGGLAAGFLASALLPVLEWAGGYTTDVTLLEYANQNHPLLRKLIRAAPGTYQHSIVVGNLAEAAAGAIEANGLLAKVAAYYHDVGKMEQPEYFAENQRGYNPHDRQKPSMSALILKKHVKETRRLLEEYRIPKVIIDTAISHHGTTLMEFFYEKAKKQAGEDEVVIEENFRYPGPKPKTKVAAILMLADAVEASVRSLARPNREEISAQVDRIMNKKFQDGGPTSFGGQLSDCDLTFRDLTNISRAFVEMLTTMYHSRPTYPGQQEDGRPIRSSGDNIKSITTTRDIKLEAKAKERAERLARQSLNQEPEPGGDDRGEGEAR